MVLVGKLAASKLDSIPQLVALKERERILGFGANSMTVDLTMASLVSELQPRPDATRKIMSRGAMNYGSEECISMLRMGY